ncbi:DUF4397 domain-containing protein [Chitinophaga sp. MM2321]|uniref:DUF4397 domain-containing protein n=1 Tax=Chitinophaga sp. MM2321 TaxID=3137178 RepID=UPI0032D58148
MLTKKNRVWAIAALFGGVIGFSACLKDKTTTPQRMTYLAAIINGATEPAGVNIYNNNVVMNSDLYKTGQSAPFTDYPGLHTYSFRNAQGLGLDSVSGQYDSLNYYTMITYNDGGAFRVSSRKEDFSSLSNSKVNYRFLNLSPNSGPIDLYIDSKKIDSNRVFGVNAAWNSVDPYNNSVTYVAKFAGTDSTIAVGTARSSSSSTSVAFLGGRVYTIYLSGMKDSTGDKKLKLYYLSHTSSE